MVELGLSLDSFWSITLKEYVYRSKRRTKMRQEALEDLRLVMWASVSPHSKQRLKPSDFIKLPGDIEPVISKEKQEAVLKAWENL